MSTKSTVSLICVIGGLAPSLTWLGAKTGHTYLFLLGIVGSFAALGLMAYAGFHEQTTDDKSERVSSRMTGMIFCCVGLYVAFCFYRALVR
jgi:uncharacterized membrane protein YeaQ/YmgE (transglycosylase-associated protein family)